jgi:hypothetical protein
MTNRQLSLMQIRHALGLLPGAQLRVEASGRVWTLRLIDAQHDYPAMSSYSSTSTRLNIEP